MPTGLDNKWVFGVRHIDLKPPGDMVVAIHPASRLLLQGHPTQIISQPSERERVKATVTALLQAFFRGSPGADHAPFAPSGWSTDNPELADAIGLELAAAGISGCLENVRVCSAKDKMILEEVWSEIRDLLMCFSGGDWSEPDTDTQGSSGRAAAPSVVSPGDSSKCHGCALASETFSSPMKKCSGCQKAWYHSQDCQRSHWKKHKGICVANRPVPAPSTTSLRMDPTFNFYNNIARKSPEGQALLRSLNINPITVRPGMDLPLRRLIIAGKDTPENLRILFGPTCLSEKKEHERIRLEVLIDPCCGSPLYMEQFFDDTGTKPPTRAVRPPTDAEKKTLTEVREIQEIVRQKFGTGRIPDAIDMQDVLKTLGPDWPERMHLYMLAINSMGQ
ncbi:hypothetical protein CFIO01_11419 [Colletotrichum fioriniae PJ7]|uniref:MYND-type domain-containing protein n=1 Tax=Colletotrichum fioriniae PJ7 TaxID=1445577 RepID=A0A010RIL2_9PEZI|nr:hypothetical protein CFIO01_11419 [Colletotrichum fioriniae PJ7]